MRNIPGKEGVTRPDTIADAPIAAAPSLPCATFEVVF